jgi:predicted RNase H-like nuclease (RuvC/YqgF family)
MGKKKNNNASTENKPVEAAASTENKEFKKLEKENKELKSLLEEKDDIIKDMMKKFDVVSMNKPLNNVIEHKGKKYVHRFPQVNYNKKIYTTDDLKNNPEVLEALIKIKYNGLKEI